MAGHIMFDEAAAQLASKLMQMSQARQGVLANNLANANTPGYTRLSVSHPPLDGVARSVVTQRTPPHALSFSSLRGDPITGAPRPVRERSRQDGPRPRR